MPLTIAIAHDFICPWCWVGVRQAKRLQQEFGVTFDWRGFELYPEGLQHSASDAAKRPPNKPRVPSRFELLLLAEGLEIPKVERPWPMRTHNAHEAVEYAKKEGVADALVHALYWAYWEDGLEIDEPKVIKKIAKSIVEDVDAMMKAIEKRKYKDAIVGFDEDAHKSGIYNVPTFYIGGERYAEQPYVVLRKATKHAAAAGDASAIYRDLNFPEEANSDRPYIYTNMVTTVDGKSVSGEFGDDALDLGSSVDHKLMKRLEASADAVLVGAQTLRAASPKWNPASPKRIVVSLSGNLPAKIPFFTEGQAYIATNGASTFHLPNGARVIRAGAEAVDFELLLSRIRSGLGVKRLLVLGGSELNASLMAGDFVDEVFLTMAPKVKLGRCLPTYAGGEPLSREDMRSFRLIEHHAVEDEVFLRYRRHRL